jgi:hypothetical protein
MDPKHPNIAFAANTGALVFIVGLLFSFFLPVGTAKGWAMPESTLAVLIPLSFAISWWAKREHDIPIVHAHGGANSQYEEMEDLPTMVSLDTASENVNPKKQLRKNQRSLWPSTPFPLALLVNQQRLQLPTMMLIIPR